MHSHRISGPRMTSIVNPVLIFILPSAKSSCAMHVGAGINHSLSAIHFVIRSSQPKRVCVVEFSLQYKASNYFAHARTIISEIRCEFSKLSSFLVRSIRKKTTTLSALPPAIKFSVPFFIYPKADKLELSVELIDSSAGGRDTYINEGTGHRTPTCSVTKGTNFYLGFAFQAPKFSSCVKLNMFKYHTVQHLHNNNTRSQTFPVSCGVAQGRGSCPSTIS